MQTQAVKHLKDYCYGQFCYWQTCTNRERISTKAFVCKSFAKVLAYAFYSLSLGPNCISSWPTVLIMGKKKTPKQLKLLILFNRPLYPCIWGEIYLHLSQQTLTEWHGPKLFLCRTQHVTPFIYHVWNFQSMESWSKSVIFQYEKFAGHIQWMWFGWRFSYTSKLINKI